MATTVRITDDVYKRLKILKGEMEKEIGAPVSWSIIFSDLAKKEGY